jgi:hypothetical protein
MNIITPFDISLGSDLLYGARAIADFLGIPPKTASNKLTARLIPAGKEGGTWVSSRSSLRAHYDRLSAGSLMKETANGGRL